MIVAVYLSQAGAPSAVALAEPEDLKAFKLVATGGSPADLPAAISAVGKIDDDGYAWVEVAALRELAADLADDAKWNEEFDAMVSYAGSKGWVSDDGGSVRAHCEFA